MYSDERFYKVFVSSTYEDLMEERNQVFDALLRSNCFPVGMEHFPSSAVKSLALIQKYIDQCDYFVVVSAGTYGSLVPKRKVGFVEWEYDYALNRMPCYGFLHKNIDELPGKFIDNENREKLESFRKRLRTSGSIVDFHENPDQLGRCVLHAFQHAPKDSPATGWVRATSETVIEPNPLLGAWRLIGSTVAKWSDSEILKIYTDQEFIWLRLSTAPMKPVEYITGYYEQDPYDGSIRELPRMAHPHDSVVDRWQEFSIVTVSDDYLETTGTLSTCVKLTEKFERFDWGHH